MSFGKLDSVSRHIKTEIPKFAITFEASDYEFYEEIQNHSSEFQSVEGDEIHFFHRYHRDSYGSEQMFYSDNFSESFKNQILLKTDLFSLKRMFVLKVTAFIGYQRDLIGLDIIILAVPDLKSGSFNSALLDIILEVQQVQQLSSQLVSLLLLTFFHIFVSHPEMCNLPL